ncbi:GYDIA family GHMP kinase [Namhaeicola litoreus]|uniref:GYDIA family GHMP kinase n=1 Tax=Namhaeicola litoreus TaxID=1052145 RepID=A0ABW3Y0X7_9FLAO
MSQFYSHGKLLITGEYLVLDGAEALAVPTKFGQDLRVKKNTSNKIHWKSFDNNGKVWFQTELDSNTLTSTIVKEQTEIENRLIQILQETKKLNTNFLVDNLGYDVETHLEFDRNWGLGTSSSLINNIASWAQIDPFKLLKQTMGGSGYDIACAQNAHPILYKLRDGLPEISLADFTPPFEENLFFVFLNQKQNSREGIAKYRSNLDISKQVFSEIDNITKELILSKELKYFDQLLAEHEKIISSIIKIEPVQNKLFKDYFGQTKSLGAWGGDFILATGNENTPGYFNSKGFETVIPYREMVL